MICTPGENLTHRGNFFNANAPAPLLLSWVGKRLVLFSEMPDQPLNVELLKSLTEQQGATISGRQLYKGEYENFHPTFGMLGLSQHTPTVNKLSDTGLSRRIKPSMTTQEFVVNPDPNNPYQSKADEGLKTRIVAGEFSNDLFWFCATAYMTLGEHICKRQEVLPVPERIEENLQMLFANAQKDVDDDVRDWLVTMTDPVPRNEASGYTEILDACFTWFGPMKKWFKANGSKDMSLAKASILAVGAKIQPLNGRRILIWKHPRPPAEPALRHPGRDGVLGLKLRAEAFVAPEAPAETSQ
jgi:hypothetical protein